MGGDKSVLAVVALFVLTALAGFVPTASADEGAGKSWRILFDDVFMEEPATDSVYNLRTDGVPFRLGDVPTAAQALRVRLCNDHAEQATGARMTLEPSNFGNTVTAGIRAVNGGALLNVNQTNAQNIAGGGGCGNFEFAVNLSAAGTIGKHPLRFDLVWTRASTGADSLDNVPIEIWVSSLFDPVADLDNHKDLPRLMETTAGGNGLFLAAKTHQPAGLALVPAATVNDLRVNLNSLPASMAAMGGAVTAYDPVATAGAAAALSWRLDLTGTPAPGLYDVGFNVSYKRNPGTLTEVLVREEGLSTRTGVDFTPIVVAELPQPVTLARSNFSTFEVRFRNIGNVPLREVVAVAAADGPAGDFFFGPSRHYENDDATLTGQAVVGNLAVGGVSAAIPVTVARSLNLPPGLHRLALRWNGWMLDDGATESAAGSMWMRVGGQMVDDDANPRTPEAGQLYRDVNENGRFDGGDGVIPGTWPGAFVELTVPDPGALAVLATAAPLATADVTSIALAVTLTNTERFALLETAPHLKVGPGTPFLAPGDPAATVLAATVAPFTLGAVGAGDAARVVTFTVDLNTAWWRADSRPVGSHLGEVLLDATNADTAARLRNTSLPFRLELVGFGPNVLPSVVANGPITGGQTFTLEVQLRNTGDDVARNVEVTLTAPVRTVALLDGFFAAHRNVSLRLTDFGVGTYADMVAAEALAERALSSPGGRVLVLTVERLAPGESRTVNFTLLADPSVIPGATYPELITVRFADSQLGRTLTKGPFTFLLKGADDRKIVIAAPGAGAEGGFFSPGPGALAAVAVSALAGAVLLRGRRPA